MAIMMPPTMSARVLMRLRMTLTAMMCSSTGSSSRRLDLDVTGDEPAQPGVWDEVIARPQEPEQAGQGVQREHVSAPQPLGTVPHMRGARAVQASRLVSWVLLVCLPRSEVTATKRPAARGSRGGRPPQAPRAERDDELIGLARRPRGLFNRS
jgi:hypothetical protein